MNGEKSPIISSYLVSAISGFEFCKTQNCLLDRKKPLNVRNFCLFVRGHRLKTGFIPRYVPDLGRYSRTRILRNYGLLFCLLSLPKQKRPFKVILILREFDMAIYDTQEHMIGEYEIRFFLETTRFRFRSGFSLTENMFLW